MPYITQNRRQVFSTAIAELSSKIEKPGDLNYVLYKLMIALAEKLGNNYDAHNAVMGAITCCQQEYYRIEVVPYEETKKNINGSID